MELILLILAQAAAQTVYNSTLPFQSGYQMMNETADGHSMYITWGKFRNESQGATQMEFRVTLNSIEPLKMNYIYQVWFQLQNPYTQTESYESFSCTVLNSQANQQKLTNVALNYFNGSQYYELAQGPIFTVNQNQRATVHPWSFNQSRTTLATNSFSCAVSRYLAAGGVSNFGLLEKQILKVAAGYRVVADPFTSLYISSEAQPSTYLAVNLSSALLWQFASWAILLTIV